MSFKSIIQLFSYSVIVCISFSACDPSKVYENNIKIPSEGWRRDHRARFEVEITEVSYPCNLYINVRNNIHYKYMDFWLFVDIYSPTGEVTTDTVKIILADHRGKWLGNGLGSKFDTRLIFRKNLRFPASGKYVFEYEQAMRDEPLTGIEDIGLRIEKQINK